MRHLNVILRNMRQSEGLSGGLKDGQSGVLHSAARTRLSGRVKSKKVRRMRHHRKHLHAQGMSLPHSVTQSTCETVANVRMRGQMVLGVRVGQTCISTT